MLTFISQLLYLIYLFFSDFSSFIYTLLHTFPLIVPCVNLLTLFILNIVSSIYLFTKFYRVLCYSKMTFDWLPMLNPYLWPFSLFHILTNSYFNFWEKALPSIKLDNTTVEISAIIGLEVLNSSIYIIVRFTNLLLGILETINVIYGSVNIGV
jgi:hypothetical protein